MYLTIKIICLIPIVILLVCTIILNYEQSKLDRKREKFLKSSHELDHKDYEFTLYQSIKNFRKDGQEDVDKILYEDLLKDHHDNGS